jgi:Na+/proline symporter
LSLRDAGARPLFYLAYLTSSCIGYNAAWHVGQRYYSVPTERDARKVAVLCAVLSLLLPLLWVAPTMAARLLFPTISQTWPQLSDPSEASFVALALTLLPNGMIGLTISAILAATMTTVDTSLNYLASILVRDVFVRLRTTFGRAALQEKRQLRMSRVTACVLGTLAIATALIVQRTKGVFDFALMYYSWFTPSMLTPVMLGFVYTKTPPWSAGVSATVGLSVVLLSNVVIDVSPYQYEVNIFGGILVSGTVFFLSSFWNRRDRDSRSRLDAFVRDLATPAVSSSFAWDLNALHSYRVVGLLTIAIGGALLAMLFVPAPHDVFVLGLIIGVCTVGLGTLIVLYFRSQMRKLPSHEPRR